jgi:GNAT superfamily N-acetyltransferase
MTIQPATPDDRQWIGEVLRVRWQSTNMAVRGRLIDALTLPAFIAVEEGRRVGLLTYEALADEWEIITVDALEPGRGVGSELVDAVARAAGAAGIQRLLVMTTNDNLDGLRFYQRRGFRLAALRPGALAESRRLKPTIPETGNHGIPLRDELDLVLPLGDE